MVTAAVPPRHLRPKALLAIWPLLLSRALAEGSCAEYGCTYGETTNSCQCNPSCRTTYTCCDDYLETCVKMNSCEPDMCESYDAARGCQCYRACALRDECCSNYEDVCGAETTTTASHRVDLGDAASGQVPAASGSAARPPELQVSDDSAQQTPVAAAPGGLGQDRTDASEDGESSGIASITDILQDHNFLAVIAACALVCVVALCVAFGGVSRKSKRASVESRMLNTAPGDTIFRLSATKDRYDYYEEMERTEEVESILPWGLEERFNGRKVVVVLEKARLEDAVNIVAGTDDSLDEESELLLVHESLLALMDSPLNKAGCLLVYLHSPRDLLVEVHPSLRVPRSFRRFAALIAELLRNKLVMVKQGNFPLLKVVMGPVQKYFPRSSQCYGLVAGGRRVNLQELADPCQGQQVVVFAISTSRTDALSERNFGVTYIRERLSICPWGLQAASSCTKLCSEFEQAWGVYNEGAKVLVEEQQPQSDLSVVKPSDGHCGPCDS